MLIIAYHRRFYNEKNKIHKEEKGYWVSFPDIPEALTQGDSLQEAYEMAVDCLGLALSIREDENQPFPVTSFPDNINLKSNEYLVIIEFNLLKYKKRTNSKAVKKTLRVPEWMNTAALKKRDQFFSSTSGSLIRKT